MQCDRILEIWRLAKRGESKERITEALNRFIAEISVPMSTPASIPDIEQMMEWVQFAEESMEHGRYEDAKRDLSQALRIAIWRGRLHPNLTLHLQMAHLHH